MRPTRWLVGSAFLSLYISHRAAAGEIDVAGHPVRVDITSTTIGGWHTSAPRYGEVFERLNVATGTTAWQLSARLDTATFFSAPSDAVRSRYTPEKFSLTRTGRVVEVTAGDAYVSIGRGLALSLRKVDELGVDTTLRGGKVLVHGGVVGALLAVGLANPQNVDEASGKSIDDPHDLIGAVQGQVRLAERVTVGVHGTGVAFHDAVGLVPGRRYQDRFFQGGPVFDAPRLTRDFGVYVEGIAQSVDTGAGQTESPAFGVYGTATGYLGPATILFEGKAYGGLHSIAPHLSVPEFEAVAYNQPPTVERVAQVLENPQRDIAGGRVRLDWTFTPTLLVFANYGFFRDWQGYDDPEAFARRRPARIHDPYAGFEARWGRARSWLSVSSGYRAVIIDHTGALVRGEVHADVDVSQSLGDGWSLTFHGLHRERSKHESAILNQQFREGTLLVGGRIRPSIAVAVGYDYTTEPTQPQRDYFNGNVQWDITPSSSLRLFVGSARGGLKCVSGVCRSFPPFEGGRLAATLRF